jgi:hypothetical protein
MGDSDDLVATLSELDGVLAVSTTACTDTPLE